jgi:Zn-dependent protease with chaperone function
MNYIPGLVWLRIGYMVGAAVLLWLIQWKAPQPGTADFSRKRFRFVFLFRAINLLLLTGYAALALKQPIWGWLQYRLGILPAMLLDDLINLILLIGFLLYYLWLSYQNDRTINCLRSSYGSYLMQYSYFWLFTLNILIFLRLDSMYLPLIPGNLSPRRQWLIEALILGGMLLLQSGVLLFRRLKMSAAGTRLRQLVTEVAGEFGIKVRSVRVWHLERVANAFATGLFMKSIFLTDTLLEIASPEDLRMIIGHECAHFKRYHLLIRVAVLGILVMAFSTLVEDYPELHWSVLAVSGLAGFLLFKAISRAQEFDADRYAARILGGPAQMATALTRVFGTNTVQSGFGTVLRWLVGHPDLETRIKRLQAMKQS